MPDFLSMRFKRLRPYELFTSDEWIQLKDECYLHWRDTVFPCYKNNIYLVENYRDKHIDFSMNLWQQLGKEFEQFYLFVAAVRRQHKGMSDKPEIIAPSLLLSLNGLALEHVFPGVKITYTNWYIWMDSIQEWIVSLAYYGRTLLMFFAGLFSRKQKRGNGRFLWLGISPQEVPDNDLRLNCAWAAQYGHLPSDDVLHFIPMKATPKQRGYMAANGIHYIEPYAFFSLLPFSNGLRAVLMPLLSMLRGIFQDNTVVGAYRFRFAADGLRWFELAVYLQTEGYFTTTSSCWPEKSELAVMKCLGVRTVIWSYSANALGFSKNNEHIGDKSVQRSFFIADEYWAWVEAVSQWLEKRRLPDCSDTKYRAVGAMMCGDIRHLSLTSGKARELIGLPEKGFFVGVFDVPPVSSVWIKKYAGGPPLITLDYAEAFFSGIRMLLYKFPSITVMFKLKRGLTDTLRDFPPVLRELLDINGPWIREGRVILLDVGIDPFLPVAASNAAIGMVFTSPVLLAGASQRFAKFYDPLAKAAYPSEPALKKMTVMSENELLEIVGQWLNTATVADVVPEVVLPFTNHHNILKLMDNDINNCSRRT